MRALQILQQSLDENLTSLHTKRRAALWRVVEALLIGGKLWLTALGRELPTPSARKHAIKAVDRLLGDRWLYTKRRDIWLALAQYFLPKEGWAVILVDTTDTRPGFVALSASLAFEGRSIPLWATVASKKEICQRRTQRRFLRDLSQALPAGCHPILVTDAGFQSPWFDEVSAMGWDFVGRVRNRTKFLIDSRWQKAKTLHRRATNRPRNLGLAKFPKHSPNSRRLILSKQPKKKGRKRLTRAGRVSRKKLDSRKRALASEPWLLATSLRCNPSAVVNLYALRMQCEEMFRDTKCNRWGWSLAQSGSRSAQRIEMLLLVGALGAAVLQILGQAGEEKNLHLRHQANTIRKRRVLSLFMLGRLLLRSNDHRLLTDPHLFAAVEAIRNKIQQLAPPWTNGK